MLALQTSGYAVYMPFGENTRTDLIVDYGGRLSRVQCKTGRLRNGVVSFATCSSYAHHPNPKIINRDYEGEVDEFAAFARSSARSTRCRWGSSQRNVARR
jgi:hypothetical protein